MRPWMLLSFGVYFILGCGSGNSENTGGEGGVDVTTGSDGSNGADGSKDATHDGTGGNDAADVVTGDATDAVTHDVSTDAKNADASHRDPCGTLLEGGVEVYGPCDGGGLKCCPGGTPGSYACMPVTDDAGCKAIP